MTTPRIAELDGIRGLAILLVVVWHYIAVQVRTEPGTLPAYGMKLLSFTWAGVDLFFVLSGFLIGGILLDQRGAQNYFRTFYARRFFRIFPLYYAVLGLYVIAVALAGGQAGQGLEWLLGEPLPFWSYAAYLQNFEMAASGSHGANWLGITWSLAIEEQFYLLLPLMVRFVSPAAIPWLLTVLVISAPFVRGILLGEHQHGAIAGYVLLPGRWDALFLGVLGACALRNQSAAKWLERQRPALRWVVAACGVLVLLLMARSQGIGSWGMAWFGHTVLAVMFLGIILLARLSDGGGTRRIFRHPLLVWAGTVSYGVYLLHQPVSGVLHASLRDQAPRIGGAADAAVTLLGLIVTLALARLSWQFLERPLIRRGQRLTYH